MCRLVRRKPRLLLAVLALHANKPVSTGRLIDWLWDSEPPRSARQNLNTYVSEVRKQLGGDGVDHASVLAQPQFGQYLLRLDSDELDAEVFEALLAQGCNAAGKGDHALAAERLTRALGLWRTEVVLDGLTLPAPLWEKTERLIRLRETAEEALFEARLALGHHRELIAELEAATSRRPLSEQLWALRMIALYRSDRRNEAISAYQQLSDLLAIELSVEPGKEIGHLHQRILANDPELTLRKVSRQNASPAQLPTDLRTFAGRDDEVEQIRAVSPRSPRGGRSATAIIGMAGVGKTALAVHAAHELAPQYPDGQLFIDLHGFTPAIPPRDPADALGFLLRSLSVPEDQIPSRLDERMALWRTQTADRSVLVVLDNAADEEQVRPLLPSGHGCLVIVTSRRRLDGLDGTASITLDLPSLHHAVAMFAETVGADRLRDRPPGEIRDVAELCGRLPLALRIAAARYLSRPTWTLAYLVERLSDQQRRLDELEVGQRSLAASFELSYAQLSERQQRVIRLLGIHPGADIEVHAAAALTGTDARQAEQILEELLDINLLQQHTLGRYRFHDLVRAYAERTCLHLDTAAVRSDALARLVEHYFARASAAMDLLYPYLADRRPPRQSSVGVTALEDEHDAVRWLDAELDNILKAILYAATHDQRSVALRMCATVQSHLRMRARYADSQTLHNLALDLAQQVGDRRSEHDALAGLAHAHCGQGRLEQGIEYFERALHLARDIGYPEGERDGLDGLANVHLAQGRFAASIDCFEQAIRVVRETDCGGGELGPLLGLANAHMAHGQVESAAQHYEQALALARSTRDRGAELRALVGLARSSVAGKDESAINLFGQALDIARLIGDPPGEFTALYALGNHHLAHARHSKARECFERILASATQLGDRNYQFEALQRLGHLHYELAEYQQALDVYGQAFQLAAVLGRAAELARARHGQALAHTGLGELDEARSRWQHAADTLANAGLTTIREATLEQIRAHLDQLGAISS